MRFFIHALFFILTSALNLSCVEAADSKKDSGAKSTTNNIVGEETIRFPADWRNFKKPSRAKLEQALSQESVNVTQDDGTEAPFRNSYWDNKADGIYVDIVSGEPLFVSSTKYKSGTGWPSFYRPIDSKHIVLKTDYKLGYPRTEVRSKIADSHLGHVFNDGPKPTGKRYCMNSAAMKFIPKELMSSLGYGEYLRLLDESIKSE